MRPLPKRSLIYLFALLLYMLTPFLRLPSLYTQTDLLHLCFTVTALSIPQDQAQGPDTAVHLPTYQIWPLFSPKSQRPRIRLLYELPSHPRLKHPLVGLKNLTVRQRPISIKFSRECTWEQHSRGGIRHTWASGELGYDLVFSFNESLSLKELCHHWIQAVPGNRV